MAGAAAQFEGICWLGKTALLRADLNLPLHSDGGIADAARLHAVLPTIRRILNNGGGVSILSHLGRPQEGKWQAALSLRRVAEALAAELNAPAKFGAAFARAKAGEALLLENTRFNVGERANSGELARQYAACGDIFVMDAFATAHREEASVAGVAALLPVCAGLLLQKELSALRRFDDSLRRPFVGVFGGAKIAGKLELLLGMAARCDVLLVGGGMANTLLLAAGKPVGASLAEPALLPAAKKLLQGAKAKIVLPQDGVVAKSPQASAGKARAAEQTRDDEMILDIGEATRAAFAQELGEAASIFWNGPMGLFERPPFAAGTAAVAAAVAASSAYSLIGGGDTLAAAARFNALSQVSHVSTGGGALLALLAGERLPGLAFLGRHAA